MTPLRRRFLIALTLYTLLGVSVWFTLEGNLRWMVLILLGALALKTWIAVRREEIS